MAVKIRLARRGRKKLALYDVVVADARAPRDGRFIEKLGTYNPNTDPATINLDEEKAFDWVMKGAQPTDTVRAMLSYKGVMMRKHLQIGVNKGAITQEQADKKLADWLKDKELKIAAKIDKLGKAKEEATRERLAAERKVSDARAQALKEKAAGVLAAEQAAEVAEAAVEGEATEAVAEEAPAAEAPAEEATASEAPATVETPAEENVEAAAEEAPATTEAPAEATTEQEAEEAATDEAPAAVEAPATEAAEEEPAADTPAEESADDSAAEEE